MWRFARPESLAVEEKTTTNQNGGCIRSVERKTLDSNDQNQVADQLFSLKQWFAGGAQSRGLRKPGCGHCYLRLGRSEMGRLGVYKWYRIFRVISVGTGKEEYV